MTTKHDVNEALKDMLQKMMEVLMEQERDSFLGYQKHQPICSSGERRDNHRNGYYSRDFLSSLGKMSELKIPRDRVGDFFPQLMNILESRSSVVEDLIVGMYAKGMSTRDITSIVSEVYGDKISPQTVTNMTQEIMTERAAWEKRPLKSRYTAIFIDCIYIKLRRDTVATDATYVIGAIDENGYKDILGMYVGACESATMWEDILKDLKDRGVKQVLTFVFDGLTSLEEAVARQFPKALQQRCVVHQTRSTLSKARHKHKQELADDLKTIYTNVEDIEQARKRLDAVINKWGKYYPSMLGSWEENLEALTNFLNFPEYLRRYVYTTNWLERVNKELRKVTKNKNSLPTEDSLKNLLYFKIRDICQRYENRRVAGFEKYKTELDELWKKRYPKTTDNKQNN